MTRSHFPITLLLASSLAGLAAAPAPAEDAPAGTDHRIAHVANAAEADLERPHAHARLLSETGALVPGTANWMALHFRIDEGWNLYWNGRSDSGFPPTLELRLPAGFEIGEMLWPAPERHVSPGDILDHIYTREVAILFPLRTPPDLTPGSSITISGRADWLACKNLCIPESMAVEIVLPLVAATAEPAGRPPAIRETAGGGSAATAIFAQSRARLPQPLSTADPAISVSWHGEELRLQAPRATGLSFFPAEDCAPLVHPLADTATEGVRLTLRLQPDETQPLRVRGVLEVRGTGSSPHWYAVDVSTDSKTNAESRKPR